MKINANYILGLTQADGNFTVNILKKKDKYLWLEPKFNITLHKKNENIIKDIVNFFGKDICHYRINNKNICRLEINGIKNLYEIIIPFFIKNKLKSNKYISFLIFKIIVTKLYNKEHYINKTQLQNSIRFSNVLLNLINMCYYINPLGRSVSNNSKLLNYFNEQEKQIILSSNLIYQDLLDKELLKYPNDNIELNMDYINGLYEGNGNLTVYLEYNQIGNLRIRMGFNITQDIYNKSLLEDIKLYFNCGHIFIKNNTVRYDIKSVSDITNKVLPKFNQKSYKNSIKLYKLKYVLNICNYIQKTQSSRISSLNDLKYILTNIYYIGNNENITLENYIKTNMLKYKLKK